MTPIQGDDMMERRKVEDILLTQQNIIQDEIKRYAREPGLVGLSFEFPELLQFAVETILLQIWLNMVASGLYDWLKGRILARKQLAEGRHKLYALIASGHTHPSAEYLYSADCYSRVKEVLLGTGLDEMHADLLALRIISVIRATTPEEVSS